MWTSTPLKPATGNLPCIEISSLDEGLPSKRPVKSSSD
jgi:hypothetical protein